MVQIPGKTSFHSVIVAHLLYKEKVRGANPGESINLLNYLINYFFFISSNGRISGSHPGGLGSIPNMKVKTLYSITV